MMKQPANNSPSWLNATGLPEVYSSAISASGIRFAQIGSKSARPPINHKLISTDRSYVLIIQFFFTAFLFLFCSVSIAQDALQLSDGNPLAMPSTGSYGLRILSPTLLELTLINTKASQTNPVPSWDFVTSTNTLRLPSASDFAVTASAQKIAVKSVGFKRRPLYAPLRQRDLRIQNCLYLELVSPVAANATVEVKNPGNQFFTSATPYKATADPLRLSPAVHVNQVGYTPGYPKKGMVGYYAGSLGEMNVPATGGFDVIDASTGSPVFHGILKQRKDAGFSFEPTPYQQVYEADFSSFETPGEYRLLVPGLGASFAFLINEGTPALFARTFALGLYHQRCGTNNVYPFTRHTHDVCHFNPASVPSMVNTQVQSVLYSMSRNYTNEPRHTAPQLKDVDSSLYPFVNKDPIDLQGGHHDAGDYSKYTINSAELIHHLVFAADSFPGAGDLDNLGIPESGDGKSDLLQEAKWEADFLAKMQDADGGFYFLVYPRDREYEDNVTPDHGDPQVVFPKTTAVTAAAVAALAEAGSSPRFKQQFPVEAALYLEKAVKGWGFLMAAIAAHGKDGAYQKISHYGNEFMHDDELAWAAAALYAATGNPVYQTQLIQWFPNPNAASTRRWTWWKMFEGYGCAIRTYAFAARSGRLLPTQLNTNYLAQCEAEIIATGDDQARFSQESAYGLSFPDPSKQDKSAGWFFASERAYDMTVAYQLSPKPAYIEALVANFNYEGGCNPVNMTFVTGLGWKRQRDIVHQYSLNDRRTLPASGLPLGNLTLGFAYLYPYGKELGSLPYPPDSASTNAYPLYDRWGDSYNTTAEFVIMDQARSLASLSFWMARGAARTQPWKAATGQIVGLPSLTPVDQNISAVLVAPGIDLSRAQVVWEVRYLEPNSGNPLTFAPKYPGETWIEAEALLPDGRRIFAATNFIATTSAKSTPNSFQSAPVALTADTMVLFHCDGSATDNTGKGATLTLSGNARLDASNLGWMANKSGGALRFLDLGDQAVVSIPTASVVKSPVGSVTFEAMVYINELKAYDRRPAQILSLNESYVANFVLGEDTYQGLFTGGGYKQFKFSGPELTAVMPAKQWHHLSFVLDKSGYTLRINGQAVASFVSNDITKWGQAGSVALQLGDFDGWIDEIVVRSEVLDGSIPNDPPDDDPDAVATPVISSGAINSYGPTTVSLQCATLGATIHYTVDGTVPSMYSPVYAGPLTLTQSVTVRARGFMDGLAESEIATASFTILSAPNDAAFVKLDTTTSGSWRGVYGGDGFHILGRAISYPAPAQVTFSGQSQYIWTESTVDPRALLDPTGNNRSVIGWYASDSIDIDLHFADSERRRVALYCLDWDRTGREQTIEIFDGETKRLLNTQTLSDFGDGVYAVWDMRGHIIIRLSNWEGPNAVLMGLFFSQPPPAQSARVTPLGRTANGSFGLRVAGETGHTYRIEASSNFRDWTPVKNVQIGSDYVDITDPNASTMSQRFYRAILVE